MAKTQKANKKTIIVRAVSITLAALMVLSVILSVVMGSMYY